jgi:hypothetical protein
MRCGKSRSPILSFPVAPQFVVPDAHTQVMSQLYTKDGRPLQVSGSDVYSRSGKHLGQIRGDTVFGTDGRYAGIIVGDRVVYRGTDSARTGSPSARSRTRRIGPCERRGVGDLG